MRLIYAEEAVEYIKNWLEMNRYYHPHSRAKNMPIDEVIDRIERTPTADAEPVRRGRWIENRGDIMCSQCGIEIPDEITWLRGINAEGPFFCPNCGAKMEV